MLCLLNETKYWSGSCPVRFESGSVFGMVRDGFVLRLDTKPDTNSVADIDPDTKRDEIGEKRREKGREERRSQRG